MPDLLIQKSHLIIELRMSDFIQYQSTNKQIQSLTEKSKEFSEAILAVVDEVENVIVGQEKIIQKLGYSEIKIVGFSNWDYCV